VDIDAGIDHSIAVDDANGHVWTWGKNNCGQLGNNSTSLSDVPVCVLDGNMPGCDSKKLEGIIDVAVCCGLHSFGSSYALDNDGNVWSWGSDGSYWTIDDGLQLEPVSDNPCIDAGDGDAAPYLDLFGFLRSDSPVVDNDGTGHPDYADIGAYESFRGLVHFTGVFISYEWRESCWSEAFVDDSYSDIVGPGQYSDTEATIPTAHSTTLDSIAISTGLRLIIYPEKNFQGEPLLDKTGPAVIYNVHWIDDSRYNDVIDMDWPEPLQTEFPQSVREWSETDMYDIDGESPFTYWWAKGSFKIIYP